MEENEKLPQRCKLSDLEVTISTSLRQTKMAGKGFSRKLKDILVTSEESKLLMQESKLLMQETKYLVEHMLKEGKEAKKPLSKIRVFTDWAGDTTLLKFFGVGAAYLGVTTAMGSAAIGIALGKAHVDSEYSRYMEFAEKRLSESAPAWSRRLARLYRDE